MSAVVGTRRPRGLLVAALALLALVVALGLVIVLDPASPLVQPLDDVWRSRLGSAGPEDGPVVVALHLVGEPVGWLALGVVVPGLLLWARRPWPALTWELALLAGVVASQVGKYLVGRPRPAADPTADLYGPLFSATQAAFPSGHATAAAVVGVAGAAVAPVAWRRWWWVAGTVLCAAMVWQRTLVNAHWLTDTLGGLALGAACGLLVWWAMWPWLARDGHEARTTVSEAGGSRSPR
ncbi:phosphatase PAP2 family protein [Isoptericola halotolerans]|uniref:phosphatase PAP2 family protein n=1 Tax=Isoptericola halotolerans TaxID=300560 RepID=UPI0038910A3E